MPPLPRFGSSRGALLCRWRQAKAIDRPLCDRPSSMRYLYAIQSDTPSSIPLRCRVVYDTQIEFPLSHSHTVSSITRIATSQRRRRAVCHVSMSHVAYQRVMSHMVSVMEDSKGANDSTSIPPLFHCLPPLHLLGQTHTPIHTHLCLTTHSYET